MPLRPELYNRLVHRFRHVEISGEGEEMVSSLQTSAHTGKKTREAWSFGEYYRINCPFCGDLRQRLWINHQWGRLDPETDSKQLYLAHCFNENCLKEDCNRNWLYADVFSDFATGDDVVLPGKRSSVISGRECVWPGDMRLLTQLPDDHPANVYLRNRGFDPDYLGRKLNVSCVLDALPDLQPALGRILIPFYMHGKAVGWTARSIGNRIGEPKYWTMPGMKKSQILYNYDMAKQFQTVCICEGPTDVWRVGPSAVALSGKTMSEHQKQLTAATWGNGTAIVLLDGDAQEDGRRVYDALAGLVQRRVLVNLPDGKDPGDFTQEQLQEVIAGAMQASTTSVPEPSLN